MKDQGVGSSNSYDNLAAVATFKNQPSTYFFSNLSSVGAARWSFQNAPSYKYYILYTHMSENVPFAGQRNLIKLSQKAII